MVAPPALFPTFTVERPVVVSSRAPSSSRRYGSDSQRHSSDARVAHAERRGHRALGMSSHRSHRPSANGDGSHISDSRGFSNARQQPADAMMETLRSVQADSATTTAQRVHFQQLQRQYNELYRRARAEAEASLVETSTRHQQQMSAQRQQQEQAISHQHQHQHQHQQSPQQHNPQPPQHRVYLIDCQSCGAFLTDRGMKAVLLLRPHITLYSTDAMPNCGPLFAPSRTGDTMGNVREAPVERTCDCLTQTLACYGCGSAVGYHIVSPCARCTSSVAKHQRSSNGHRTVLHCSEITVRERRYIPGEPGVLCAPLAIAAGIRGCKRQRLSPADRHASPGESSRRHSVTNAPLSSPSQRAWFDAHTTSSRVDADNTDDESDFYNDEEEDGEEDFDDAEDDEEEEGIDEGDQDMDDVKETTLDADPLLSQGRQHYNRQQSQLNLSDPSRIQAQYPAQQQQHHHHHHHSLERERPTAQPMNPLLQNARHLQRGDVVYWSDLTPGGERSEPIDSDRVLAMPMAGR